MSILEGRLGLDVWRQSERGQIEMVWTCAEERRWVYREKDAEGWSCRATGREGKPKRMFMDVVREDAEDR